VGVLSKFSNLTDLATWNPGLVFFADRTIENMYNILEIIYQDAFGSEYKQFLYFSFIDGVPSFLPISQPI